VESALTEIEENIASRQKTDRIMWFSMWFLLSLATFGAAWFLMIYFLIKRRNDHFARQEKLETIILNKLERKHTSSFSQNSSHQRNAEIWALSTLLVLPLFYILYFLMNDLLTHEEHEHAFLIEFVSAANELELSMNLDGLTMTTRKVEWKRYSVLTFGTLGVAAVYWLFRIFNDYNNHFKRQWKLEDELLKVVKCINTSKET
jgi:hypothetical protein